MHDPNQCANDPEVLVTVRDKSDVSLTGPAEICVGEVTIASSSHTGGTWISSNDSIALISNDGIIVGLTGGTASINYLSSNGCLSDSPTSVTVNPEVSVTIDFSGDICIEDGSNLKNPLTIKIDINSYKAKYYIEPPKYISRLPESYIKLQKKFYRRAYLEILEKCSNLLTRNKRIFTVMYTLEGELIDDIDEIPEDSKFLVMSQNKDNFIGVQLNEAFQSMKSIKEPQKQK